MKKKVVAKKYLTKIFGSKVSFVLSRYYRRIFGFDNSNLDLIYLSLVLPLIEMGGTAIDVGANVDLFPMV